VKFVHTNQTFVTVSLAFAVIALGESTAEPSAEFESEHSRYLHGPIFAQIRLPTNKELSAADAKTALIEMLVQSGEHKPLLEKLKKADPKQVNADEIMLDLWHVNLKERTFVLSLIAPPKLLVEQGTFFVNEYRKWSAKVVKTIKSSP
jgi:hypothetical protein